MLITWRRLHVIISILSDVKSSSIAPANKLLYYEFRNYVLFNFWTLSRLNIWVFFTPNGMTPWSFQIVISLFMALPLSPTLPADSHRYLSKLLKLKFLLRYTNSIMISSWLLTVPITTVSISSRTQEMNKALRPRAGDFATRWRQSFLSDKST